MPTPSDRNLRLVGVTGGIGSGKSTVCRLFATLGRTVIHADDVARTLTDSDPGVQQELRDAFGDGIFSGPGSLDRRALAALAFGNPERMATLNAIVHPKVFEAVEQTLTGLSATQKTPYVIIEAALIYESGMDAWLNRVVVVDAPEEVRIRRVMERDKSTREDVLRRIQSQMPAAEKAHLADFVIKNEQNAVDLEKKVRFIDFLLQHLPAGDLPDEE